MTALKDNADGKITLPEYDSIAGIFNTLSDKVRVNGRPQMGTFLVSDEVAGIMVLGPMDNIIKLSRIIAAIGSSPLVKMGV